MGYIPTEWQTGDIITAAKLNNMEQGIEDASLPFSVCVATADPLSGAYTYSMTAEEVFTAFGNGEQILLVNAGGTTGGCAFLANGNDAIRALILIPDLSGGVVNVLQFGCSKTWSTDHFVYEWESPSGSGYISLSSD